MRRGVMDGGGDASKCQPLTPRGSLGSRGGLLTQGTLQSVKPEAADTPVSLPLASSDASMTTTAAKSRKRARAART